MNISMRTLNKSGVTLSRVKLVRCTEKYTKQYGIYCARLYNMGYSSTRDVFDESNVLECMYAEFPEFKDLLIDKFSGDASCSLKRLKFVIKGYPEGSEERLLLEDFYKLKEAHEALVEYGVLANSIRIPKTSDNFTVRCNIYPTSYIVNDSKCNLDSPFIQEIFACNFGDVIKFDWLMVKKLYMKYGGTEADFNNARDSGESLFFGSPYTFDDDCEFYRLIFNGEVEGKTEISKRYYSDLVNNYVDYYNTQTTKATCVSLGSTLFIEFTPDLYDYISGIREELGSLDVAYITNNEVILKSSELGAPFGYKTPSVLYIGEEASNYITGEPLSIKAQLQGYSGKFIKESDIGSIVHTHKGSPIKIDNDYWYHVGSVFKDGVVVYKVKPNNKKYRGIKEVLGLLGVSSMECISTLVATSLNSVYGLSYNLLVGRLVRALVCIKCDYVLKFHSSANEVLLSSEMLYFDDDIFKSAFEDAERIFNDLGV